MPVHHPSALRKLHVIVPPNGDWSAGHPPAGGDGDGGGGGGGDGEGGGGDNVKSKHSSGKLAHSFVHSDGTLVEHFSSGAVVQ